MAEGGSTALFQLLTTAKLSDIVPDKQDVVILEHNQTVGEALKVRKACFQQLHACRPNG